MDDDAVAVAVVVVVVVVVLLLLPTMLFLVTEVDESFFFSFWFNSFSISSNWLNRLSFWHFNLLTVDILHWIGILNNGTMKETRYGLCFMIINTFCCFHKKVMGRGFVVCCCCCRLYRIFVWYVRPLTRVAMTIVLKTGGGWLSTHIIKSCWPDDWMDVKSKK